MSGGSIVRAALPPGYYASYVALLCAGPALALWAVWRAVRADLVLRSGRRQPAAAGGRRARRPRCVELLHRATSAASPTGCRRPASRTPAMQAAADYYGTLLDASAGSRFMVAGAGARGARHRDRRSRRVERDFRARNTRRALGHRSRCCWPPAISILTTAGIVFSVLFESIRFFEQGAAHRVPVRPAVEPADRDARRPGRLVGRFGAVPLFAGTLLITVIAMLVAGPIGLFSAIYLSRVRAARRSAPSAKPMLEILAGIPTVVYGFFAALTVAPFAPRARRGDRARRRLGERARRRRWSWAS